jgi:imidazolonepropionase
VVSHVLFNIGQLTTNDPTLGDGSVAGRRSNAALVFDNGVVSWVGDSAAAPAADSGTDCRGGAVVPGFVDSHTHLVFAGDRSDEFVARMAGASVTGGILTTVDATRRASSNTLRATAHERLAALRASGVTTVEVKSGYDLTTTGEQRLVEIAATLTDDVTFLGAHAVPPEWRHDRDHYVSLVAGAMLDACAPHAKWADVFCDDGAFDVDESRHILQRARDVGLALRLHGNQRGPSGGIALAVELGAASVDHCTFVSADDLAALAGSTTVATLLPGAEFSTRSPYPSGRRLLDAGVTVALATDCNPGTSYVTSMPFVIALAVREMGMSPDEAVWAATRGGALALRRTDVVHLGLGATADAVVLEVPGAHHLAYRPGHDHVRAVFRAGVECVVSS